MAVIKTKRSGSKWIGKLAALLGIAVGAHVYSRVKAVRGSLTAPRKPCAWKPPEGNIVLLKGADLLDVKRGLVLRNRGLVLSNGQISSITPTRDLEAAQADLTIDCRGLFIMPGLINAHCHPLMPGALFPGLDFFLSIRRQAYRNLEDCITHGVTTVRGVGHSPRIVRKLSRRIESMELLGPRIVSCGCPIAIEGGFPDFIPRLPDPILVRNGDPVLRFTDAHSARGAVREAMEQGGRFIKIYLDDQSFMMGNRPLRPLDDEIIEAILDEAHGLGMRVCAHQTQLRAFRRALDLGIDDLEHIPSDELLTDDDVKKFLDGDHHITPTISFPVSVGFVPEGHPARSDPLVEGIMMAHDDLAKRISPAFAEEAMIRSNRKMLEMLEPDSRARKHGKGLLVNPETVFGAIISGIPNILKLYEAGASICCGNDSGTTLLYPGNLSFEMAILNEIGLSKADVLKAATINGARLLGLDREIGSLDKGKAGDLLVLSSNPLKDIRAVERVEAVFRGRVLLHTGHRLPLPETQPS